MSVSQARGAKAKADKLFSKIVRARGSCEKCGEARYEKLTTAHIISRGVTRVRVDLGNAFCLCYSCHGYFTSHPVDFGVFTLANIGEEAYWELVERSRTALARVDWDYEVERLTSIWKPIEAAA